MILKVDSVFAGYGNEEIINNISFTVEKGDYICIVGENGSGKSTLVRALANIINIKSGSIQYFDVKNIGYLPQQSTDRGEFPATVYEVVLSGCLNKKRGPFFSREQKNKVKENIKLLGIENIAEKQFCTLSGGQKQRVLLARALCATDSFLLLDEPVTGLDPIVTDELYKLISKLNKEKGITVLMVSHDVEAATKYAKKVLHIKGNVKFFGKTEEYLSTELGIHFTGRCCPHHD